MDKYNLEDLNTTTFKTPQTTVESPVPVLGGYMDTMISDIQKQEQAKLKETETQRTDISDIMKVLGQEGQFREQLYKEGGADEARLATDEYTSAIEAEQLAMRRQLEKTRMTFGGTTAGLQDEMGRVERESLAKQADLAILQNASLRRYETMSNIAERKVQALLQPYKTQLDVTKFLYEENKQDLTKAQDRIWSQKVKQEERQYEKTENELRASNDMILNAIQGNAPKGTIAKAQQLANSGASKAEVANILGKYSLSQADRLDLQLKQSQLSKTYADIESMKMDDLVELQKQYAEQEKILKQNQEALPSINDKMKKIKDLMGDPSIAGVVGPTKLFGRLAEPFDIFGNKANFVAGVENLISEETLDTLINLKKEGGTLGALSDQERMMLKNAASKIGFWAIEKKGKVVGYDASEKDFKKELDQLLTLTERAYVNAGGIIPNSEREEEVKAEFKEDIKRSLLNTSNFYQSYSNI